MTAKERAERLMRGATQVLAFPEKLTPAVKAMAEDSFEVAKAYLNLLEPVPAEDAGKTTDPA